jgi:hypothetical protein
MGTLSDVACVKIFRLQHSGNTAEKLPGANLFIAVLTVSQDTFQKKPWKIAGTL